MIERAQIDHTPDVSIIPLDYFQIAFFCDVMIVLGEVYVTRIEESVEVLLVGVVVDCMLVAGVVDIVDNQHVEGCGVGGGSKDEGERYGRLKG